MTQAKTIFTVQVPATRAAELLPKELVIDGAGFEMGLEAPGAEYYGPQAKRFSARWTRGSSSGPGHVEIRPSSKLTSEIEVSLHSAGLFGKLLWTKTTLNGLAALFARGLRYELETRALDEADGFDVRRTSAELVKARTA